MVAANKVLLLMSSLGSKTAQSPAQTVPATKEPTMYIDYVSSDKHSESAKTNYLLGRFNEVKSDKQSELRRQFGLENDPTPYTAKELVERIKSGKFILPTKKEEDMSGQIYYNNSPIYAITWRDPAVVEDQTGYDDASKKFKAASLPVHDAIMLKTNDEALTAINALVTWTPTA